MFSFYPHLDPFYSLHDNTATIDLMDTGHLGLKSQYFNT